MDVSRMVIIKRDSSPLCQDCGLCCTLIALHPSAQDWLEGERNHRDRRWLESDLVEVPINEAMETGLLIKGVENKDFYFYRCQLWDPITSGCTDYANRPGACRIYPYGIVGSRPAMKSVYESGCRLGNFLYSLLSLNPENVELRKNGHG